eukprot:303292-Ditylum_brightwellii.AAC.1
MATFTNLLVEHQHEVSPQHLVAAKHAVQYLVGTKNQGIQFINKKCKNISSYVKFPIFHQSVTAITDANWGPQDQAVFRRKTQSTLLELDPCITACSPAESGTYATDECVKQLIHLKNVIQDLDLQDILLPKSTQCLMITCHVSVGPKEQQPRAPTIFKLGRTPLGSQFIVNSPPSPTSKERITFLICSQKKIEISIILYPLGISSLARF